MSGLPGVRTRDGLAAESASGRFSHGPMVQDLDALPYPDYSDYFQQFEASRYGPDWQPSDLPGDVAGMLVGREEPLHVLRAQRPDAWPFAASPRGGRWTSSAG